MTQVHCSDACGRRARDDVLSDEHAAAQGWTYLEVQKRWRCPECSRELASVNAPRKPRITYAQFHRMRQHEQEQQAA